MGPSFRPLSSKFSNISDDELDAEREKFILAREKMEARLKAEVDRLRALEAQLKEEEMQRKQEMDHRLSLGSRGGPSYKLDDPNVAASMSGSLLAKLRAAGITDLSNLDEKAILALNLSEEELNELLGAVYLAKYLKASPGLCKALKKLGQDPLTLWKLQYQDVQNLDLSEDLKKELFGHVLEQRNSFVANVEIPTSRKIILKGWKDENLAFLQRHEYDLVTKDFESKRKLTSYIDKLRAGSYV